LTKMNVPLNHRSGWRRHGGREDQLHRISGRPEGSSAQQGNFSMTIRLTIAKGSFAAAVAAMTLAGALAAPQVASAQQTAYDARTGTYYDPCQRDKTNREIAGGVLGAIGGAVIGSNLAHGGGRDGGAVIGGVVGAAGGAAVGGATAACDSARYDDNQGYNGPPPPPPPQYDDRYNDPRYPASRPYEGDCTNVESRVYFPDGTVERDQVRACRGGDGHWFVAE
jgi:hypothetical protein